MLSRQRGIGPVDVVDEAGRHALEEADRCRTRGIIDMPKIVPDLSRAGGVKAAMDFLYIVAGRAIARASAGKNELIRTRTWYRSNNLSTNAYKFDSLITGSTLRRKEKSSHKGFVKGGCSSSRPTTLAPLCLSKGKRSNQISTCGTSESAM